MKREDDWWAYRESDQLRKRVSLKSPQCGSSARWDLCGGSQVTGCPTVKPIGPEEFLNRIVEALGIIICRHPKRIFRKMES